MCSPDTTTARISAVFDMETRDPDDVLALCLLATHPAVELVAVTVTPGTGAQIGVVRAVLGRLGRSVPIGARDPASARAAVSQFHYDWLGAVTPAHSDGIAHELLAEVLSNHPGTVLLTGAPLHNLRLLLRLHPDVEIARWVAQGGFAGDSVVPPEHRLSKFTGRETCETFNFGGDRKGALAALSSPRIARRELVSKNVTHGVAWDAAFHRRVGEAAGLTTGASLAYEAMGVYLRENPGGKLLHDPLAASAMIEPSAFQWAEVEVFYQEGRWGARAAQDTGTRITTGVDRERALATLLAPARLPDGETTA